MPFRYLPLLLVLSLCPWFLGCEDEEVVWLPDSSGLIFRDETRGWTLYDLKKQAGKQILKPTEANQQGIAISPKGDQFALGTVTGKDGELRLQITIYSQAGEVVQKSNNFAIGKYESETVPDDIWLEWSSNGKLAAFTGIAVIGLYDPKSSQMLLVKGYSPYLEARYLGSNLIPDGSGLLAMKAEETAQPADPSKPDTSLPNVEVVDWQGRIRSIKLPATPPALQKELADPQDRTVAAEYGAWVNQTLRMQTGDFRLDIDTKTLTAKWYTNPLKLESQLPQRDPEMTYTLVPIGVGGVYAFTKSNPSGETLAILDTKTKKVREIGSKVRAEGALRSPDGSKVALTYLSPIDGKAKSKRTMIIVDQTGATIATVERGETDEVVGQPLPLEGAPPPPAPGAAPAAPPAPPAP